MKKIFLCLPLLLVMLSSFGQGSKFSLSAYAQYHHTLIDRAITNNSFGTGLNLVASVAGKRRVAPAAEIEANHFWGDKRLYPNGRSFFQPKEGVYNLFAGVSIKCSNRLEANLTAGPSLYNSGVFIGLKPSASYGVSKSNRWRVKVSWVTVLQNNEDTNWPFSYLSIGIGAKLF